MAMPDVIAAVVAWLSNQPSVVALVGDRVYGAELPRDLPADGEGMPVAAVLIQASPGGFGGLLGSYVRAGSVRFDLRCYGPTFVEADAVYRAVHPLLKQQGRFVQGATLIYAINPVLGATSLREPDSKWPFVFASYAAFAAEEELVA